MGCDGSHPERVAIHGQRSERRAERGNQRLDGAKRYDWIDRHADDLQEVREIYPACDDDPAGKYLRHDLVSLLGADRCRFVEYPFPAKTSTKFCRNMDRSVSLSALSAAKPFPVQGLYKPSDFPERGEVRSYDIEVEPIHELIRIVPGTLTVLTGFANMGKSSLMNAILGHD